MKEIVDNPKFYEHVFYSKRYWQLMVRFALPALLTPVLILFVPKLLDPSFAFPQWATVAMLVVWALFFTIMIYLLWYQSRIVQIGIGSGGVYLRGYGLITWNEIKQIELGHRKRTDCIIISTETPQNLGKDISGPQKVNRFAAHLIGENPDEILIAPTSLVSVSLNELNDLLKMSFEKYQKEKTSWGESVKVNEKKEEQKQSLTKKLSKRVLVVQWLRMMALSLFALFFFSFGLYEIIYDKEIETWLILFMFGVALAIVWTMWRAWPNKRRVQKKK